MDSSSVPAILEAAVMESEQDAGWLQIEVTFLFEEKKAKQRQISLGNDIVIYLIPRFIYVYIYNRQP